MITQSKHEGKKQQILEIMLCTSRGFVSSDAQEVVLFFLHTKRLTLA